MASIEQTEKRADRGILIRIPRWWKVAIAFLAGGALVAASLTVILPHGLAGLLAEDGGSSLAGASGELQPGQPGQVEEFYIDKEGKLRRRLVTTGGGAEAGGAGSGQSGTAGQAGTAGRSGGRSGGGSSVGGGTGGGSSGGGSGGSGQCKAGSNGGATDIGVSATKINLATTAVLDGPAASLLRDSVTGMKAVIDKVNKSGGGICGRLLELRVDNDSFDAARGQTYIRNYIESKSYFALPVVPSAEGLGAAIQSGFIADAGIPVVGTDGMRQEQYDAGGKAAWVWPVAAATVSTMRVMAKYGKELKGAQTFAIVWDSKYKFGIEGRDAFVAQVSAMGGTIPSGADRALDPQQASYATEADAFNNACGGGKCDMVALLLLPETAKKWMARNPALGRLYTSGAQTLFTDRFGQDCVQAAGERCNGIFVWTGYNPPIGALASSPGVSSYVNDVRAANPTIDVRNQFLQGAYLGMSVFVEALKRAGPTLTRAALRQVLDSMDYQTDLASTLSWRAGNHWANVQAQAFSMVVTQGTFNGWRNEQTGWVRDPEH